MNPKIRKTFAAALVLAAAVAPRAVLAQNPAPHAVLAPNPAGDKPGFLFLGTFHFQGSDSDLMTNRVPDILSEKRQKEADAVVEALARYNPTKIAVERSADKADVVQKEYEEYLAGKAKPDGNEEVQIAFRLAQRLGLKKIYAVDHRTDMDFDGIVKATQANGQGAYFDRMIEMGKAEVGEIQNKIDHGTLADVYRYLNEPKHIDEEHSLYMLMGQIGSTADPKGAEELAGWYRRNLLIWSNLVRVADSQQDRVLLLIGAGHIKMLRDYVRQSPNLRLVEAVDYLP